MGTTQLVDYGFENVFRYYVRKNQRCNFENSNFVCQIFVKFTEGKENYENCLIYCPFCKYKH